MALIKCKECQKEMSDQAKTCPHCGYENNMTFCPECNKKVSIKAKICPFCGNSKTKLKTINDEAIKKYALTKGEVNLYKELNGEVEMQNIKKFNIDYTKWCILGILVSSLLLLIPYCKYNQQKKFRTANMFVLAGISCLIVRLITIFFVILAWRG